MTNRRQQNTLVYEGENRITTRIPSAVTYTYDGQRRTGEESSIKWNDHDVYFFRRRVIAEYRRTFAPRTVPRHGSNLFRRTIGGQGERRSTVYYHQDICRYGDDQFKRHEIGEQGHYPFGESWYARTTTTKWPFTSYERDKGRPATTTRRSVRCQPAGTIQCG